MTTGRLQQTIKDYRAQLAAQEARAVQALEHAYANSLQIIGGHLQMLYQAMEVKINAGQEIPVEWLYENQRLQTLEQFISDQINHFGALTQMQVGQLQHQAAQLGSEAAQQLLQATVPPGVNWSFGVPSPKAIADLVGATQRGSPLYELFQGFGAEAAQDAKQALITGVTLGYNPRDIAPSVQDALGTSRARALTIARTEQLRAYRLSALENYRANDDVVGGWIWQAALDRTTCAACIAMNGSEHTLDESLDSHPNCRCVAVPRTKGWDDILAPLGIDTSDIPDTSPDIESGTDWFDRQSEETQRAILGNAAYKVWSEHDDISLMDFVGKSSNEDWGDSIYQRSVKQVLARK